MQLRLIHTTTKVILFPLFFKDFQNDRQTVSDSLKSFQLFIYKFCNQKQNLWHKMLSLPVTDLKVDKKTCPYLLKRNNHNKHWQDFLNINYCKDPKFSERQVGANSVDPDQTAPQNTVDPDQTAPLGAVWSGFTLFAIHSVCIFWTHYCVAKRYCSNFSII